MRRISKEKYLAAALITGGIFLLGLLLGIVIEGQRTRYVESVSKVQNLDYTSMQLQYTYIDQLSQEKDCGAVAKTFEENIKNLELTRERIENFDKNARLNKKDFELLKREYMLAQLRYWLLAKKTKELCSYELSSILYFYSSKDPCDECEKQAFVLTYLKKRFKEKLLVFSFDGSYEEEPMIALLKHVYSIEKYPTIIIEGIKFDSFKDKNQILKEICKYYTVKIEDCYSYHENAAIET